MFSVVPFKGVGGNVFGWFWGGFGLIVIVLRFSLLVSFVYDFAFVCR